MLSWLKRRLSNIPGWHTKRKIVVLDSDDWGSVALPSRQVFRNLSKSGFRFEQNPYLVYDSLASEQDLTLLFDLLTRFKDSRGNHPVISANTVMANPDFEKIRQSDFKEYHYKLFTETLQEYPNHQNSFKLWKQAISQNIFFPQFHAREHINIAYWMKALREGHPKIRLGFDNGIYILDNETDSTIEYSCTSAHYPKSEKELHEIKDAVRDGLHLFKKTFGYSSNSFTGTGYLWSSKIESMLSTEDVRYLKGLYIQRDPIIGTGRFRKKLHFTGQRNRLGLIHLVRNVFFEPGLTNEGEKCITDCLDRINVAFACRKPVIISTHRINFIGHISEKFRNDNLRLFELLIKMLLKTHPDVEFMNSNELGELIVRKKSEE